MQWFDYPIIGHPVMWGVFICFIIQLLAWQKQRVTNNADTVDIAWTLGIILCALIYLIQVNTSWQNVLMILLFPVLWYLRLLFHLLVRYDVAHEDSRYQNLRAHWSEGTQIKFLYFFLFQAILSVLFSLPAYWVMTTAMLTNMQIVLAVSLGVSALIGVTIADHQLLQFKRKHDVSQVCDHGLWKYSRHPNYFFEWLHWFVYPILLWETSYFGWSCLMVGIMLLFLLKLTGIPFSEQQALKKRGQLYQNYMNRTSPFILWRPKND